MYRRPESLETAVPVEALELYRGSSSPNALKFSGPLPQTVRRIGGSGPLTRRQVILTSSVDLVAVQNGGHLLCGAEKPAVKSRVSKSDWHE